MNNSKTYLLFLLLIGSFSSKAQFNSQGVFPFLDIRSFISLNVEVVSGDLEFYFNQPVEYTVGINKNSVFQVEVKSNKNWRLSVSSPSGFFTPITQNSSSNVPVSILSIKKTGSTPFLTLSTIMKEVANGNRGSNQRPGNTFFLDLKATPGTAYSGGSYNCEIMFTITPD